MASLLNGFLPRLGSRIKGLRFASNYLRANASVNTLAAAKAPSRIVLGVVRVLEDFGDHGGTQPTFKIGETASTSKYAATSVFVNAKKGDLFVFAGTLTATKALLVTGVAAVGSGTGAISVEAMVLPASA